MKTTGVESCFKSIGQDVENLFKILTPVGHTVESLKEYDEIFEVLSLYCWIELKAAQIPVSK